MRPDSRLVRRAPERQRQRVPEAFQVFCPSTHRVLSGGTAIQRPNGSVANGNIGTNWHLSNRAWAVAGTPFGPIGNRLVGFALCVPV